MEPAQQYIQVNPGPMEIPLIIGPANHARVHDGAVEVSVDGSVWHLIGDSLGEYGFGHPVAVELVDRAGVHLGPPTQPSRLRLAEPFMHPHHDDVRIIGVILRPNGAELLADPRDGDSLDTAVPLDEYLATPRRARPTSF